MLPPYPYASFALVENFWETGYGMPGFTLLGPTGDSVSRGSSLRPTHTSCSTTGGATRSTSTSNTGNWCEGLTAYMADHLFAEQRGEGATYRRATLKKFTDMVSAGDDFPLSDFWFAPIRGLGSGRLRQESDALPHGPPCGR